MIMIGVGFPIMSISKPQQRYIFGQVEIEPKFVQIKIENISQIEYKKADVLFNYYFEYKPYLMSTV